MTKFEKIGFIRVNKDTMPGIVKPGGVLLRLIEETSDPDPVNFILNPAISLSDFTVLTVDGFNYTRESKPEVTLSLMINIPDMNLLHYCEALYYPDAKELKSKLFLPKMYLVGGAVRDEIQGLEPNDLDFAVEASSYEIMKLFVENHLKAIIKTENPEYTTLKALYNGQVCDFVLCRKDGIYKDGRHPDSVEVGTIFHDLARRDFTINAMAKDMETGEILDPYNGRKDLEDHILRCVGDTEERMREDSLRLLRAMRFILTKNLRPDTGIEWALRNHGLVNLMENINADRIYQEYSKCYKQCTLDAIVHFHYIYQVFSLALFEFMEKKGISVMPTLKKLKGKSNGES